MTIHFFIENIGNLVPYGILLLVYLFLSFQSELQKNRIFAVPALGVLLLFVGFSETITPDMENYRRMYEAGNTLSAIGMEPSFIFICRFLNAMGFDYHALFVVYSLVTLLFVYLGIKNYTDQVKLSLLLFVLIPNCFLNMFVEIRELCAIAIVFYATSILSSKDKKFRVVKILALAVLSVSFHYSAIVYWGILLILYKAVTRTYPTIVYLSLIISSVFVPTSALIGIVHITLYPLAPAKYQAYFDMYMRQDSPLAGPAQLLKSVIYVLLAICFIFWRSSVRDRESDPVPINLFLIGVVILNLSRSTAEVSRLAFYFLIHQIVIFPLIVARVNGTIKRLLATYVLFLFYLAEFAWGLFYYSPEAGYVYLHYRNAILSALR